MSRPLSRHTLAWRVKKNTAKIRNEERKPEWRTAQFDIKVYPDTGTATVGNGAFIFMIPADLVTADLVRAEAYVTTVGSAFSLVQIRNITNGNVDMLSTRIRIDASEFTSYTSSVPSVVNPLNSIADTGDLIAIDIDASGTTALGLGVVLDFA